MRKSTAVNLVAMTTFMASIPVLNYVVDPFGVTQESFFELPKDAVASNADVIRWKLLEFRHLRYPCILLGDSRLRSISEGLITETTGEKCYNFLLDGTSAKTSCDVFWYADSVAPLRRVCLGLGPENLLHDPRTLKSNRVIEVSEVIEKSYFIDPVTTRTSIELLLRTSGFFGGNSAANKTRPLLDRDRFWDRMLRTLELGMTTCRYPRETLDEIRRVAAHCRKKGIEFEIVYLPSHQDVLEIERRRGGEQYEAIITELRSIAPLFYYNYSNALTKDRTRFSDPIHFNRDVGDSIVMEVFGGKRWLARYSEPPGHNTTLLNNAGTQPDTMRTISSRPFVAQGRAIKP